jgi:hypothetical protein
LVQFTIIEFLSPQVFSIGNFAHLLSIAYPPHRCIVYSSETFHAQNGTTTFGFWCQFRQGGKLQQGEGRDDEWGTGPKDFLRRVFKKKIVPYQNFFNDILEPLFHEALAA